jgi:rhamnosyltransferase
MSIEARHGVGAVVVTFNPNVSRLEQVVASIHSQVSHVVVVDNGSSNAQSVRTTVLGYANVEFLALEDNRGIAAALNEGIRRTLGHELEWVLTMDQDTIVSPDGVESILRTFADLDAPIRDQVGILAMRAHPQPSSIWITRYAERLLEVGRVGGFIERRAVMTSGNLIRADVASTTHFNESLFIDQVDYDYCFAVRRRGLRVLMDQRISLDHVLGERFTDSKREHPYENAQRVYYIIRNSTYLVIRRRLRPRFYAVQMVVHCGAFVSMNGAPSAGLCALVAARGVLDGVFARLGRREYPFLAKGRR